LRIRRKRKRRKKGKAEGVGKDGEDSQLVKVKGSKVLEEDVYGDLSKLFNGII